jgi:hypothetical protein
MAVRDVVQAAAGVGGGDKLYVEDVFSTYLYTGNGSTQSIENGIALGDSNYGPSVEFDGISDYLSRSSDMTGNTNSKSFTYSMWVYTDNSSGTFYIFTSDTGNNGKPFAVNINSAPNLGIVGYNSAGGQIFNLNGVNIPEQTFTHVLVSIDLTTTANRYVFINDVDVTSSVSWLTYTNDTIDFTHSTHRIGNINYLGNFSSWFKGRLSNVFLDHTYRDLSVEANRRLFITADGQPATGLASLSPILYMPLDGSTASVGTNSGTGGDFTVNGSPTVLTEGGPYTEAGYGQGGLVWLKDRLSASLGFHTIYDTEGGTGPNGGRIFAGTAGTNARSTQADGLQSFNSTGFTLGANTYENGSGKSFASWTFRKSPKFFDVVTFTGTAATQNIAHNLGSVPGMIIVKSTTAAGGWAVWHNSLSSSTNHWLRLDWANGEINQTDFWPSAPTDSQFTVGGYAANNAENQTIYCLPIRP